MRIISNIFMKKNNTMFLNYKLKIEYLCKVNM